MQSPAEWLPETLKQLELCRRRFETCHSALCDLVNESDPTRGEAMRKIDERFPRHEFICFSPNNESVCRDKMQQEREEVKKNKNAKLSQLKKPSEAKPSKKAKKNQPNSKELETFEDQFKKALEDKVPARERSRTQSRKSKKNPISKIKQG